MRGRMIKRIRKKLVIAKRIIARRENSGERSLHVPSAVRCRSTRESWKATPRGVFSLCFRAKLGHQKMRFPPKSARASLAHKAAQIKSVRKSFALPRDSHSFTLRHCGIRHSPRPAGQSETGPASQAKGRSPRQSSPRWTSNTLMMTNPTRIAMDCHSPPVASPNELRNRRATYFVGINHDV